jgi:hypothetical protein
MKTVTRLLPLSLMRALGARSIVVGAWITYQALHGAMPGEDLTGLLDASPDSTLSNLLLHNLHYGAKVFVDRVALALASCTHTEAAMLRYIWCYTDMFAEEDFVTCCPAGSTSLSLQRQLREVIQKEPSFKDAGDILCSILDKV